MNHPPARDTGLSSFAFVILLILVGCGPARKPAQEKSEPLSVILETDIGNDIDDALALDMLYKYFDQGKIRLLAISNNKNGRYSIPFLRIMNNWYGHPAIPLGNVKVGARSQWDPVNYAQAVYQYTKNGQPIYTRYIKDSSEVMESVKLYRKVLAAEPDTSVNIISIGFSTNLAVLIASEPDNYSSLSGVELVRKKVKLLSMMGGSFNNSLTGGEYNIVTDTAASKEIFSRWPTRVVISPHEVGNAILYPSASIENDLTWASDHPLKVAYESYLPMPYDRPTWDLTSVLYVTEPNGNYFILSEPGRVSIGEKGVTNFTAQADGLHSYLKIDSLQAEMIRKRFIELVKLKPAKGVSE